MSEEHYRYVKFPVYDPAIKLTHPAPVGSITAMVSAFEKNYGPHGIKETMLAVYNALMEYGKPVESEHERVQAGGFGAHERNAAGSSL